MATILIVEDEMVLGRSLARYLGADGDRVVLVSSGPAALEEIRTRRFDVVITDLNMPDGDGIELITALREKRAPPPIIAISGGGLMPRKHLLEDADLLGAAATFEKPFDPEELRRVVHQLLGRKC